MIRSLLLASLWILPLADQAFCQWYGGGYYGGGYAGGGYHHASTAAEGYARGMADVIRSQGEANLANAQALSGYEDARAKYIDNRNKATAAYYERRKLRDQYKAAEKEERAYYRARRTSELTPLTAEELDPSSGKITWPELLQDPQYDQYREVFDKIFAQRAADGIATNNDYVIAVNTSKEWRQVLTEKRDEYVFNTLRDSILFIRRLENDLSL
ncbi:hypothetical protein FYK55_23320 [Roseiconus nitratireducens]|uniref:Uncharacterized protein n=1 Tax=Roseiconus nitratireducens TaxID=2605748 RepID=A0A5M6D0A9_9BACT|nr:hypothetical protein [Roseiconus nitratireducens]KAA5539732.1 hypothetical protein FYK55_23320 [Roseiconus nitratireducens]